MITIIGHMIDLADTLLLPLVIDAERPIAQKTQLGWERVFKVWFSQSHLVVDVARSGVVRVIVLQDC